MFFSFFKHNHLQPSAGATPTRDAQSQLGTELLRFLQNQKFPGFFSEIQKDCTKPQSCCIACMPSLLVEKNHENSGQKSKTTLRSRQFFILAMKYMELLIVLKRSFGPKRYRRNPICKMELQIRFVTKFYLQILYPLNDQAAMCLNVPAQMSLFYQLRKTYTCASLC